MQQHKVGGGIGGRCRLFFGTGDSTKCSFVPVTEASVSGATGVRMYAGIYNDRYIQRQGSRVYNETVQTYRVDV
jgi:hypothetical protein